MEVNQSINVGLLGQQCLQLTDSTIDPIHAKITKINEEEYVIEDKKSSKGTFVFGLRIKRKTIKEDTPIFLGAYKTSIRQLMQDVSSINLEEIWNDYDKDKREWERYTMMANSIRMLTPILTMVLTQVIGQNWIISCIVLVSVMIISMIIGEKVVAKKNIRIAELNTKMQSEYICPHCHKFLGLVPYGILTDKRYCPMCGVPLN